MNKLTYNNWMRYIYNFLFKTNKPEIVVEYEFGKIGQRTETQIQDEIYYLRDFDKRTSDKVRASYTIKK